MGRVTRGSLNVRESVGRVRVVAVFMVVSMEDFVSSRSSFVDCT